MIVVMAEDHGVTNRTEANRPGTQYGKLRTARSLQDCKRHRLQVHSPTVSTYPIGTTKPCVPARTARQLDTIVFAGAAEVFGFTTD
ncbi:MAG: hypothetical protein DWP92_02385 [Armatimonadetes bacterium]|nr:MAG: hypothetical protein DWP92_02385 [Armatimonadota bacterium]